MRLALRKFQRIFLLKTAVVRDNKKYNGTLSDLCLALFNVNEFIFME